MPINTKVAIAEAFITLAEKKNIDKITVKDIVETCGISRQAFYYHFKDILDVMEWIFEQEMQKMLRVSLKTTDLRESIRLFVSSALKHRDIIRKFLTSQRRDQIERIMLQVFRAYIREMFRNRAGNVAIRAEDFEMVVDFFSYGIAGILVEYSIAPNAEEDNLVEQVYRLLSGKATEWHNGN